LICESDFTKPTVILIHFFLLPDGIEFHVILTNQLLSYNIDMITWAIVLSLFWGHCFAQDERFYRKIFTGELKGTEETIQDYKVRAQSPVYKIDLNRDGIEEGLIAENIDGVDYLRIVTRF